jgi:hypothetical protein
MASREATKHRVIGQVFALYRPGRTAGLHAKQKTTILSAILLALSVRQYVTKRIDRQRGSRAIMEAAGRCLRASMAADISKPDIFCEFFRVFSSSTRFSAGQDDVTAPNNIGV